MANWTSEKHGSETKSTEQVSGSSAAKLCGNETLMLHNLIGILGFETTQAPSVKDPCCRCVEDATGVSAAAITYRRRCIGAAVLALLVLMLPCWMIPSSSGVDDRIAAAALVLQRTVLYRVY
ncbi:uncharacterized protein UV8b_07997 [Ustilaginoidea virens]|uniref:Transmembrane protein n=1 Tax=Ustilaginoidea virens TaxID=1159556 RepID=A0A8E5HY99_USTVR|nr:uncharacterized protein UV8b_07997 [Ustilaginoidea virens]QUC23756.1 hypothetical protein UV8b_07997 [Ustilaginoidea virens]